MEHAFRDVAKEPLSAAEIRDLLTTLGKTPTEMARRRYPAWKARGLEGADDAVILAAMAEHPGLLERPIAVRGDRAILARPPERVRELL